MVGGSVEEMHDVRATAFATMGTGAAIDAIAVSALFHLMNRVANATGTPLDPSMIAPAEKIDTKIGANSFLSRADTFGVDRDGVDRDGVDRAGVDRDRA